MTNFSGSSIENINVEIRSSELSLTSENIINIQNIDIGQTVLVEDLILNIPSSITIDEEPMFYANISGNNSSLNQIKF